MTKKKASPPALPVERIEQKIYLIRDQKVMLDSDLAELYGVETKVLNQAVKRNLERFPNDFMFQLSEEEFTYLKSQIVTSSWGGRRVAPYAFTEHGVLMLSSVLRSKAAAVVNIQIMRAFVKLRNLMTNHKELARKIEDLERQYGDHDKKIAAIITTIQQMLDPPATKKHPIGFRVTKD